MRRLGMAPITALVFLLAPAASTADFHGGPSPVAIKYENETPWTLRIYVDGRPAIEMESGYDLPPGVSVSRFILPREKSYRLEAKIIARRFLRTEWALGEMPTRHFFVSEVPHGLNIVKVVTFRENNFTLFPWYRFVWENFLNFFTAAFILVLALAFLLFSFCAVRALRNTRGPS